MNELLPSITPAGQGRVLRAFGDEITVLLSGEQTAGRYAVAISSAPPGGGPPLHCHEREDEWFHLLEGRGSFFADGKWTEASAGATVFLPKGSVHTFKNIGTTPLKMIVQVAPAGFEKFFEKCADEFAKPGAPDMARILAIADEYGIRFVTP